MALFKHKTKEAEEPEVKDEKFVEEQAALPSSPSLPKGGDPWSYKVILSPHITEKGTIVVEQNKYLFKVAGVANKIEIKKAVENLYKVKVRDVSVLYAPSKFRQIGRITGRRPGFKKALVTLKEGSKIDIAT